MTAKQIAHIVELGTSVSIDCRSFSFNNIKALARAAKASGAKITLTHICFTHDAITEIIGECPAAQLCLDFTDKGLED